MTSPTKRRLQACEGVEESSPKRRVNAQTPTVADEEDLIAGDSDTEDLIVSEGEEDIGEQDESDESADEGPLRVYRPGIDTLGPDEELVHDPSTYDTYHRFGLGHSCLSMDVLLTKDGALKTDGPHTFYLVAGSEAETRSENAIYVVKCSNIRRTWKVDEDDESDDSDDEEGGAGRPILTHSHIKTDYVCNSIKVNPALSDIVATFGDDSVIRIYNVSSHRELLDRPQTYADVKQKPYAEMKDHTAEGYALAWNPNLPSQLLSGSRDATARIWQVDGSGGNCLNVFSGHKGSVEGVSWQRDNANVFATGSADKSIRVWDVRQKNAATAIENAHNGDVNVVAFRPLEETNHLLSGGDDGLISLRDIRVPDLTLFKQRWHRDAVNVLDWHPTDNSMFLASSYDNVLSIWSMDVEAGESVIKSEDLEGVDFYPKQLLFAHQGQDQISSALWHKQIQHMILSSAADGLNVFRPENLTTKSYSSPY